jgi:hypothetical protein
MPPNPDDLLVDAVRRLVGAVEMQRGVIDGRLSRPARWRGPLRREIAGRAADAGVTRRYAEVFDWLGGIAADAHTELEEPLLREVHARLLGDGAYRSGGIRIGNREVGHPPAADVPGMVRTSLARAADGTEPAPLAAARLHLELALIHPWADGNGRTARLMSSFVLMRAGHRSTLLTAVEQHTRHDPTGYRRSFTELRAGGDGDATWGWLARALSAMVLSSQLATWHRLHRTTIAQRDGMPRPDDTSARDALAHQLRRLRAEEREDARRR